MGLHVKLFQDDQDFFSRSTTHNNSDMARLAWVYDVLWRGDEFNIKTGSDLITPLSTGLQNLSTDPEKYRELDDPNGWGTHKNFSQFLRELWTECVLHPDATVKFER
jgi:hypothetical protein